MQDIPRTHSILILGVLIILAGCMYWPSLDSPFYLDDFSNLERLSDIEAEGYAYYIFSGIGLPGRPLSLLTFALQHQSWPDNPFSFKLVNLLLHLFNGLFIYSICHCLAVKVTVLKTRVRTASLVVMAVWLIHPIHFSTTLYVVQRMTLLSSFFILAGLCGYLISRNYYFNNNSNKTLLFMAVSSGLCMVLAVLSKEIGILLALYILVIELTLFNDEAKPREFKFLLWLLCGVPLLSLAAYMIININDLLSAYNSRSFTLPERVLTEARILLAYAADILFPRIGAYTLYHDDITISRNLINPLATLFSVLVILSTIILSGIYRYKYRLLAFIIFWYFGGHILESTFIGLELYFEHRNYLPALGLILGMVSLIFYLLDLLGRKYIKILLGSMLLIIFSAVTIAEISLWARPKVQIHEWMRKHPDSKRTINQLGQLYLQEGNVEKARNIYDHFSEMFPEDLYPRLRKLHIDGCITYISYSDEEWDELYSLGERSERSGLFIISELDTMVNDVHKFPCKGLELDKFAVLILKIIQNDNFQYDLAFLHEFMATLSLKMGDFKTALLNIDEALRRSPSSQRYSYKIELFLAMNDSESARTTLEEFKMFMSQHPREYLSSTRKYNQYILELESLKLQIQ